jgi:hypothetical protein
MPDLVFPPPVLMSSGYRPIILWRLLSFSYTGSLVKSVIRNFTLKVYVDQLAVGVIVPYVSDYTVGSL